MNTLNSIILMTLFLCLCGLYIFWRSPLPKKARRTIEIKFQTDDRLTGHYRITYGAGFEKPNDHCYWVDSEHYQIRGWHETDHHMRVRVGIHPYTRNRRECE